MVVCPVCTVAIVGGAGLCRWLGIDDSISGVWIGALLASLTAWITSWLERRNIWIKINFRFRWMAVAAVLYSSVILPLYELDVIGGPYNEFHGIDKLLLGIFSGSIALLFGNWLYSFLKRLHGGKVFFPFQKVVIPVLCLVIMSVISYYFIC
jgi:hypothetical protein